MPVLRALLEAQADLIGKCSNKDAFSSEKHRQKLAEHVTQTLAILVLEADAVPGQTGEALTKTRTLLEAVQTYAGAPWAPPNKDTAETGLEDAGAAGNAQRAPKGPGRPQNASSPRPQQQPAPPGSRHEASAVRPVPRPAGPMSAEAVARRQGDEARFIEPTEAEQLIAAGFNPNDVEITDEQLVEFVVDKVAAGATAFKANKLPQILAALVREEFMQAAVAATKKALDPSLRGHIEVGAFVEWWPTSRFATPACENAWMKELNAEALRTRLMSEALHRQVEAQAAMEARALEEAEAAKRTREMMVSQPKRVQQVLQRLRKAEAAVQEVHSAAMREALIVSEELADIHPDFLRELHDQLSTSSPLMLRAKGGPFAQLIHHKARTSLLVQELDMSAGSELSARKAAAASVATYADYAESMHSRLHNRSASQCAEWLRTNVKKAVESGQKAHARHLLDNETRRVKHALELMAEWMEGSAKDRIAALPTRFESLAKRSLIHTVRHQLPQVGGNQPHRAATLRELCAHLARDLQTRQQEEATELQAALEKLSESLQPREGMPMDEHAQLLLSELWFKQRGQLAKLHAMEHDAIPKLMTCFVDTLSGPSPVEDSAAARMRIAAADMEGAESFSNMMKGQLDLTKQLDALHDASRSTRQAVTSLANQVQNGNPSAEGCKVHFGGLWRSAIALETRAARAQGAIQSAIQATSAHFETYENRELPRVTAMLEAASIISQAAHAMVSILRGDSLPEMAGGVGLGSSQPKDLEAMAPSMAPGVTAPASVSRSPPELAEVLDRWPTTAVAMQAEQQKLVAAAEDMEQHSLDMQGLLLEIAEPVEESMNRFAALVAPGTERPRSPSITELNKSCIIFEKHLKALLQSATAPLRLPEFFARMHGQLQQHKDSLNAWCYPLLKLKTELEVPDDMPKPAGSGVAGGGKGKSQSGATGKADAKGADGPPPATKPGAKPGPKGPVAPAPAVEAPTEATRPLSRPTSRRGPPLPMAMAGSVPEAASLPKGLPLPPSPNRGFSWGGARMDLMDPAIVSRVSLDLIKSLLASAEVKTGQRLTHETLVKRKALATSVVEKRKGEQQRAAAEVQALEQLLELSTVAEAKGVPADTLAERVQVLTDAVAVADALTPPSAAEKKADAIAASIAGNPPGKPPPAPEAGGGAKAAAAPKGAKGPPGPPGPPGPKALNGAKKGGGKAKKGGEEPTDKQLRRKAEDAQDGAATHIQKNFRGYRTRHEALRRREAAVKVQALARGRLTRRGRSGVREPAHSVTKADGMATAQVPAQPTAATAASNDAKQTGSSEKPIKGKATPVKKSAQGAAGKRGTPAGKMAGKAKSATPPTTAPKGKPSEAKAKGTASATKQGTPAGKKQIPKARPLNGAA